jgi:dTDP-glucose 4,6-dehydratase
MSDSSVVLVTGGAGFIGSHLVDRLLEEGFRVRVVDNFFSGDQKNLAQHKDNKLFEFVEGDIRDFDLVKTVIKGVDFVLHQAALVSVPRSCEDPVLSNEINVVGTLNLLQACVDADVKRFVFASSCAIYGDSDLLPITEDSPVKPLSPYAIDKYACEEYARIFSETYGLETVGLRYFNVYGPRQKVGSYSGVISVFVNCFLDNKSPTVFGDGNQTRDFVHVKDVVNANLLALAKENISGEVFNISSGKKITINSIIEIIQKIMDKKSEVFYAEPRSGDIRHSFANIKKAQNVLGYKPSVKFEEGLREVVKWYSTN